MGASPSHENFSTMGGLNFGGQFVCSETRTVSLYAGKRFISSMKFRVSLFLIISIF